MNYKILMEILLMVMVMSVTVVQVSAFDFDAEPTAEQKAQFDELLQPVMKLYNFFKYIATAIAALVLLFAGISYMFNGADPQKRNSAKGWVAAVVIGMFLIWGAPLIANYVI